MRVRIVSAARAPFERVFFLISRAVLTILARSVFRALNGAGVQYWADYGTLLGLIRDGGVIYKDTDVDVSVLETPNNLAKLDALCQRTFFWFVLKKDSNRRSYTCYFRVLPARCDIYVYRPHPTEPRLMGCEGPNSDLPLELVAHFSTCSWRGLPVTVPAETERFLAYRYGADFRVRREKFLGRLHSTYHPTTPAEAALRRTNSGR
jgi:hypothetical protein